MKTDGQIGPVNPFPTQTILLVKGQPLALDRVKYCTKGDGLGRSGNEMVNVFHEMNMNLSESLSADVLNTCLSLNSCFQLILIRILEHNLN